MKRKVSLVLALVMLLSMLPFAVWAQEDPIVVASVVDQEVTAAGYTVEYTAETAGTLHVSVGNCKPDWRYKITTPDGTESLWRRSFSATTECDYYFSQGGTWKVAFYAYSSAEADNVAGTVSFDVTFKPDTSTEAPEVQKVEYEVSSTKLELGDNSLSLLDTAVTTIYVFEPTEMGVYTFTAPAGATLGYWGAGSWFLSNPNSTTNTYEWTCTGVGQTAYMGVSNVDGQFNLNVAKTGDYTPVQIIEKKYENKATLTAFEIPEGAKLGGYVDVMSSTVHTAVLGDDGYYHLDSADGDVLIVDFNYQDIILSAALQSDRPVMNAYVTDENGDTIKYDIGDAIKEYEAVMDGNGYYPVTEDVLMFYDTYAMGAGTYTYHLTGMNYNEECVWMYCMRTMNMDNVVQPEPEEPTEPSEPETQPTVPSEPETEPTQPETEATEPSAPAVPGALISVTNEAVTTSGYVFQYSAATAGTLHVSVGECSPGWRYKVFSPDGVESGYRSKYTAGTECDYHNIAGNWKIVFYAYSSAEADNVDGTVSFAVTFTPDGGVEPSEPETQPTEPETQPSEPETQPTEPETQPSEPETQPTTPSAPADDVPAGTKYALVSGGNTTYYSSATAASMNSVIKSAPAGATIILYDDISLGSSLTCFEVYKGTEIILDLNGHTMTYAYASVGAVYVDGGKLTIRDSSAEGTGMITNTNKNGIAVEVYTGTVIFESGNASSKIGAKVWVNGSLTVAGGSISGSQYGINALANSAVTVSGGEIVLSPANSSYYSLFAAGTATMSVTGGYFNGNVGGSGLNGKISGGYYTAAVKAAYIASGYEQQSNADATYQYRVVDPNAVTPDPSEPETEPTEPPLSAYQVSAEKLSVGNNTVTMLDTAIVTIFAFTPTEIGTYTISGPAGSVVGNWGSNSFYLVDPNSNTNSCSWNCTGVGQSVYIGVSGVEDQVVLNVTKQEEPSEPEAPTGGNLAVTDAEVTAAGYVCEYTAATAGTLHVSVGECSPGWRYKVFSPDGIESGYRSKYTAGAECDYHNIAGNWKIVFYAYSSAEADNVAGTVSFTITFTPDNVEPEIPTEPSEPETEPTEPEAPAGGNLVVTNESVTTAGYVYTYTAETAGTLNVTVGTCTPGWRYKIYTPDGAESTYRSKWTAGESCDYTGEAGTWKVVFYAYSSAEADNVAGTVSFTVTFTPDSNTEEPEVQKEVYQVSATELAPGDNNVTLLDTAITTIFVFEPTETGVFTFTAPAGAILGYWGAGSWFLMDPNSTTNTYEWTCTGVGQTAYIGISGVEGAFNLNVEKTGDYTVVEIPIIAYENKAELEPFTVPAGATLGGYVDVMGDAVHTAVLGSDGYYHLDSADGPILLIDLDYMDIILSAALQSDRPVMYAYVTDENGNTVKYDIGEAIKAYEAVMDENGYYPVTEDILLFYQVYAMGAGTFTYHLTGVNYNEDCVWMYCMRTMTLAETPVEPPAAPTVELTHISLNPNMDALGYRAAATNLPEGAHVEISLWVDPSVVVTREATTLRLVNILKNNGGEFVIYAKATIVDAEGNVIAESAVVQTTMKETLQTVNANWDSYTEQQQNAVRTLCDKFYDVVSLWDLDNIFSIINIPIN